MQTWSITLYGPAGVISTVDTGESQFVIGTETASDVFTVHGEGVTERHAWVWISEAGLQVEDLGGGTLVNGHEITERVQVECPASVQVGELTMVIEIKAVEPVAASPTPSSLDITIPQRAVTKSKVSMEVTIPQRMTTRSNVQKIASTATPSAQPASTDKASTLCEYTLVKEIARGGMGQIYFGEDAQLKRNVAVKVSSVSEAGEDPRFSKEAEVLAQLAHPNIVPIHNIGVDAQGRPFYSMKLVKGRTLQAVLNLIRDGDATANKEYPRTTLLTIFRKVCDAMMFAHSKGILHRDLKPENIMVGEYGEVLVMDWGLAKMLGEREEQSSSVSRVNDTGDYGMTMEGEVMGTPQYMSPEQAMGMVAELDARSDIYSLGGILYAILTLRPPIDGTTLDEVLTKVKNGSISSMVTKRGGKGGVTVGTPTAMGAEVPEALQAVTIKAMATDRNKRYGSVEAFASDIERYQNGFATQAEHAGALRQLVLFIKRNKAVSVAAALFMVAVLVFMLKLGASERTARENERKAVAQMERSRRAAAAAQMSLAEAAEAASDSDALRKALDAVPEDLRPSDWNYFRDRIDTATFTLKAPRGRGWVVLEDWPSESDRMVAMLDDGKLFSLNVQTGTLQALWKSDAGAATERLGFGISKDGKWTALLSKKGDESGVEVRSLEDGGPGGGFLCSGRRPARLCVSSEHCIVQSLDDVDRDGQAVVSNWRSGERLWEMAAQHAEFSEDQKSVLLVSGSREVQRRDASTGQLLVKGAHPVHVHHWYPRGASGNKDWTCFLSPEGGWERLRNIDPWSGQVFFEVAPQHGNFASTWIPSRNWVANLGRSSPGTAVLEIREPYHGSLLSRLPVLSTFNFQNGWGEHPQISAKAGSVVLRCRGELKIWRLESRKPQAQILHRGQLSRLGSSTRYVTVNREAAYLMDASIADPQKRTLAKNDLGTNGGYRVLASPDGKRWAYFFGSNFSAFQMGKSGVEVLPAHSNLPYAGFLGTALHPTEDLVWTGKMVFAFSKGTVLVRVKDRQHGDQQLTESHCPVWVGSNHVVEIAHKGKSTVICRWDAQEGKLQNAVDAPYATWICVSPNGQHIAEAGSDKKLRIRNAETLEVEQEVRVHEDSLTGVAWHPALPFLVTACKDGTTRIWSLPDFKRVEELMVQLRNTSRLEDLYEVRIEITPDGRELNLYRGAGISIFQPESFYPSR